MSNMRSHSKLLPFSLKALNVAVLSALLCSGANAAGLGKLTVLSSLGQPLKAEIELTSVSKDEAGSVIVKLAPADAYRQANIELNPVLYTLRFNVENRGGRQFIRVSSTQPINEPIVDVLLEMGGTGSRLVREYTMLLDPADLKTTQSAQIGATPITKPSTSAAISSSKEPQTTTVPQPSVSEKPVEKTKAGRAEKAGKPAPASQPAGEMANADSYKVKQGDTLAKIAGQVKPEGVSLDQMLVALYRANKNAFIGNNMNRLRAGQILSVPDASTAQSTGEREARGVVVAQAADFNAYRNKLAGQVAASEAQKAPETKQSAAGKITAKVEEKPTAASESKDKLKLSKAGAAASADKAGAATPAGKAGANALGAEDRIAKEKALADANARVKELERNLGDLQKLLEVKNKALEEQQKQAELAQKAAAAKPVSAPATAAPAATVAPAASAPVAKPVAAMPSASAPAAAKPASATSAPAASAPAVAAATPAASASTPAASAPAASAPAASAPAASAPAAATPAASAAEAKPVENKAASTPAAAAAAASATEPAPETKPATKPAVAAKPKAKPVVVQQPEPSFMESLLDNPAMLFGGGGLLAALAGFAFFKLRRSKQTKKFDESVLGDDSSLTANSLFGSTGGQSVDTSNSVFNSSFTPSASQLDTNEVDPVAEADVYIAYGRDAQAEEILKEALRTQPERNAVRLKLLEIYANRKDVRSFETQATELYNMTKGEGDDWAQAATLGAELDPNNPLYGGSKPAAAAAAPAVAAAAPAAAAALSAPTQPLEDAGLDALLNTAPQPETETETETAQVHLDTLGSNAAYFDNTLSEGVAIPALPVEPEPAKPSANSLDFDLAGLDMKAPEVQAPEIPSAPPPIPKSVAKEEPADLDIGMLDFTLGQKITADSQMQVDSDPMTAMSVEVGKDDLAFMPKVELPALDTVSKMPVPEELQVAEKAPEAMSFDLSGINLDLNPQHAAAPAAAAALATADVSDFVAPVQEPGFDLSLDAPAGGDSEMATKLDLAIAYQEIGDKDGARELLDEVIKGGTAEQSAKAKSLLGALAAA